MYRRKRKFTKNEIIFGLTLTSIFYVPQFPIILLFVFGFHAYYFKIFNPFIINKNVFHWQPKHQYKLIVFLWIVFGVASIAFEDIIVSRFFGGITNLVWLSFWILTMYLLLRKVGNWFKSHSITPTDIKLNEIDKMSGLEFEKFLLFLFKSRGYFGEITKSSGDYGADLLLSKGKDKIAVQAKCYGYSNNVGVKAINEVLGGAGVHKANKKMVVTNQYFTPNAIISAHHNKVELVDRDELSEMLSQYNHFLKRRRKSKNIQESIG